MSHISDGSFNASPFITLITGPHTARQAVSRQVHEREAHAYVMSHYWKINYSNTGAPSRPARSNSLLPGMTISKTESTVAYS
jgi:hypothetical protein